MTTPTTPIPLIKGQRVPKGHMFCHGNYVESKTQSYLIANIKKVDSYESTLQIIENPVFPFWVTKPQFRNHTSKKEQVPLSEVEQYSAPITEFPQAICKALGQRWWPGRRLKEILDNPFIYGADIDPVVRLKHAYRKANPDATIKLIKDGMFDIEQDVSGTNQIIAATYIDIYTKSVYVAYLNTYLKGKDPSQVPCAVAREQKRFRDKILDKFKPLYDTSNFKYIYHGSDDEKDLLLWIIGQIHLCKPDFVGIWNMGFDIPAILTRCVFLNIDPRDLFCHPDVPKNFRSVKWKEDKSEVEHFLDRWDYFEVSGYTLFFDSMCLYARLRKVEGRKSTYTLGVIGGDEIGAGKMEFGEGLGHYEMQNFHFVDYVAYNVIDVMIMVIMELKNRDIRSMLNLISSSNLQVMARQTVQLKNDYFEYQLAAGRVIASVGTSMKAEYDDRIPNIGGCVVSPNLARGTGIPILLESDRETKLHRYVFDLDIRSAYPYLTASRNVSKKTKLATVLSIEGHTTEEINVLFDWMIDIDENSVSIGSTFLGLPNYQEMLTLIQASA